ncbi:alpha/beta fold hydrolase [Tsukamurella pulmonis]|uniref:alpha/beta fold hydrolase n=1 Tax=Tsukamurella pulmonis TaxID=47312 RepID=UPI000E095551|nr:alpha/beta hydrolase [Tsukamurella pulmonis]RDH11671.1 alpha/beta fold hydrolase [Tsukamurella pulmonis]
MTTGARGIRDEETHWIDAGDGARLHVRAVGPPDAPTVVLAHGWACRIEYWRPQIDELARDHRVIAFDQRGHGLSTTGSRDIDAEVLADDLARVVDVAADAHSVVVGHSMGGIAVQAWWGRHPEQAARNSGGAVLANTTWGGLARGTRVFPLLNGRVPGPQWLGRLVLGAAVPMPDGPLLRAAVRNRTMNPRHATRAQARFVSDVVRACDPGVRARTALALADLDLGPAAARAITVPTTVIVGRADRLTPAWMGRRIATELERTGGLHRLVELDTGHSANVEMPDVFTAEIRRVVRVAQGSGPGAVASQGVPIRRV